MDVAEQSTIEWTDATWNVITGCSIKSPGCKNCYAMKLAGTRLKHHPSRVGLTKPSAAGPVWTGEVRFNPEWLDQPLIWKRPREIFVCAHGDLFHESAPDHWIDRVFAVMALAQRHTFQVLTKRSRRMREYLSQDRRAQWAQAAVHIAGGNDPDGIYDSIVDGPRVLPNVWVGVSAERQQEADERIRDLLATPAAVRWVSAEPLIGSLDLTRIELHRGALSLSDEAPAEWQGVKEVRLLLNALKGSRQMNLPPLDWVVAGGESGDNARPAHPDWFRALRDQCAVAGTAFHFKQHGAWVGVPDLRRLDGGTGPGFGAFDHCAYDAEHEAVRVGKKAAGRLLDGIEHNGYPEVRP